MSPRATDGRQRFGDYELIGEIARGGMGVVYKARQLSLNRVVALKMILNGPFSSEEGVRRFRAEAEAAAVLQHPNIVAIFESGEHDGHPYFSMEYIEGRDLGDVARDQPLAAKRAADYVRRIAEAVDYAHQKGVLHRDLKPSNLLLDLFDNPKVTDFGLAKIIEHDSKLTVSGQTLGSPSYMAPEQTGGHSQEATARSDVYSLGAILYHLLTGRPPFQGETIIVVLQQVQNADPVPPRRLNPGVPVPLQNICLKCLSKDPSRRYPTAKALAEDLERFLANQPILARPVSIFEKAELWIRRHPVPGALSLALVMAVLLGITGVVGEWRRAEQFGRNEAQNLYAADINLSSQAMSRGDYGLARRTLEALKSRPGADDRRGFEWRYLWNMCKGGEFATLAGHTWIVTCAAFSPDGRLIVSGSQDGTVKLWDVERRQLMETLPENQVVVWTVSFSPDGRQLITGGIDNKIRLWDMGTRKVARTFPGQIAAVSKKGRLVAISESNPFYWEAAGPVTIWDYETGKKLRTLDRPGRALAISADSRFLAVAGPTRNIDVWDLASGALLRTLPTQKSVWSLCFSPSGRQLASAGWSKVALVWNLEKDDPPGELRGSANDVWAVTFSPDGKTLVTTSSDETVRYWDPATLEARGLSRGHDNEVWCAAFSPDGRTLASGGKDATLRLWATPPAVTLDRLPHRNTVRPCFSPDGKLVLLVDPSEKAWVSRVWDVATRKLVAEPPPGYAIGFTAAGDRVILWNSEAGALQFWSWKDGRSSLIKLPGIKEGVLPVHAGLSPGRGEVFVVEPGGFARIWSVGDGKSIGAFQGPQPSIRAAVLGPGARRLAISSDRENVVHIYETATGREVLCAGHRDFVSGLAFSPDGARFVTGSMDGTVGLWDAATGRSLNKLPGHVGEATDVAFSPDGRTVASISQADSVRFWHLATSRELLTLGEPEAGMYLEFTQDGRHLVFTTRDNTARFLDAAGGE